MAVTAPDPDPILATTGLKKHFGEVRACDGVDLTIDPDRVTSIVGPNGAGKTTLFNLLTGFLEPDEGTITFHGEDITGLDPRAIVNKGIVRSFQLVNLFEHLTVVDNLVVSAASTLGITTNPYQDARRDDRVTGIVDGVIEQFELDDHRDSPVAELPHGDRKLVDMAVAYIHHPELLLLDEPTAGMGGREKYRVIETIETVADAADTTICFIEHDLEVVRELSDIVYVMHNGRLLARGEPTTVFDQDEVRDKYLRV